MMEISKSPRHAKITGDLGEYLTIYWLSKHGFECARVDHVGIDLIARHPQKPLLFGISVKARSRVLGTENSALSIDRTEFQKVQAACDAFICVPYFSLLFDRGDKWHLYLVSQSQLLEELGARKIFSWKMTPDALARYRSNQAITCIEWAIAVNSWGDIEL